MFDPSSLLKMMGIDPAMLVEEANKLKLIAADIDGRMRTIDEKLDRVIALLEADIDDRALERVLLEDKRDDTKVC